MTPLQWTFLVAFGLIVPVLAIRTARQVRAGMETPPRGAVFAGIIVTQLLFLVLALLAARSADIELWPRPRWNPWAGAMALGVLALLIPMLLWRLRSRDSVAERAMEIILPHTPSDLPLFALVCVVVGVTEEVVYRGVMMQTLLHPLASWWLAAGLSTCAFALAHAIQGLLNTLVIVLIALAMHALVSIAQDLYAAIALHVIYDFAAGVLYVYVARPRWLARPTAPASENSPP